LRDAQRREICPATDPLVISLLEKFLPAVEMTWGSYLFFIPMLSHRYEAALAGAGGGRVDWRL
jgi:hypothetical protein